MDDMEENAKHPKTGIISVVLTGTSLVMLVASLALGMNQTSDESGYSTVFVVYIFVSMMLATIGGFAGMMGIVEEDSKKSLPATGLFLAAICVAILAYIVISPMGFI